MEILHTYNQKQISGSILSNCTPNNQNILIVQSVVVARERPTIMLEHIQSTWVQTKTRTLQYFKYIIQSFLPNLVTKIMANQILILILSNAQAYSTI